MRSLGAAALGLALAACSTPPPPAPVAAPPPAPVRSPAPPVAAARPVTDACGAGPLQRLVGRPRTEAPVPIDPRKQRVTCATCPVTMDFDPERLNIFFDASTGLIKEVRCG